MTDKNEAAERLRYGKDEFFSALDKCFEEPVIQPITYKALRPNFEALMDGLIAAERRATVEKIRERFARIVETFPTANRTQLYSRTLAFAEWLAQVAEQDEEAAR